METTTAISLDSRCLSRPMGRASPSVPLPALFECTSGKQTSGSASVWTSWPNLLVMQLASPSRWPATVVVSPSGRPRVTPTERTLDMCGYTSWQSGTQLRPSPRRRRIPRHLPNFPHLPRLPRPLLHHRPLQSNGSRWVTISMAKPATIMAGRSLCLGMACGWQSGQRNMTKMVQAVPLMTMDAFECISGYRPNGSSSEVISLERTATTRLDLRCLCPKTARDSPSGRLRKTQKARAKFEYIVMTMPAGNHSAAISSAKKTKIGLVPPSQYPVRAHASLSVPHSTILVSWKMRDTFACLSGMEWNGARWVLLSMAK